MVAFARNFSFKNKDLAMTVRQKQDLSVSWRPQAVLARSRRKIQYRDSYSIFRTAGRLGGAR